MGSPTVNKGILHAAAGILDLIQGLGFKNKKAATFGSYGWSGEAVKLLAEKLEAAGLKVIQEGLRLPWVPGEEELDQCREFGRQFAMKL